MGYLGDPEATDRAFEGGFFRSGDLATVDADGYARVRDRSKDIIISGGENVSSVEVEEALYRHPAVAAAAVVAMPHPKWGETPVAFVELREGRTATEESLLEHCRQHLAHYKCPRRVLTRQLPKTATGKIRKNVLREAVRDGEIEALAEASWKSAMEYRPCLASVFPAPLDNLVRRRMPDPRTAPRARDVPRGEPSLPRRGGGLQLLRRRHGTVRIELGHDGGTPAPDDTVLGFFGPGSVVGEMSVLDRLPRSATAYAQTQNVAARRIRIEDIKALARSSPEVALRLYRRARPGRLAQGTRDQRPLRGSARAPGRPRCRGADRASRGRAALDRALDRGPDRPAPARSETRPLPAMPKSWRLPRSRRPARQRPRQDPEEPAREPGGQRAPAGQTASGLPAFDAERQLTKLPDPVGIVLGLVPATHPAATLIFKTLIADKRRNAVVVSPSRRAHGLSGEVGALIEHALRE